MMKYYQIPQSGGNIDHGEEFYWLLSDPYPAIQAVKSGIEPRFEGNHQTKATSSFIEPRVLTVET